MRKKIFSKVARISKANTENELKKLDIVCTLRDPNSNFMKKIIFTFILTILVSLFLKGQTTLEEYNYVTKGYKVQIESGLDMKKGYILEDVDKGKIGERAFELKLLTKVKGAVKQKAAYMIVYTRKGLPTEYICIPHSNSNEDVIKKYWAQLYNGSGDHSERLQIISMILTSLIDWKN